MMSKLFFQVLLLSLVKLELSSAAVISSPLGAIASNGKGCATIGSEILKKGGSGVDVAIATGFCEGLANPQSTGVGGGCLITIYDAQTGKSYVINGRETAPAKATEDMFKGHPDESLYGGKAVAVPGEIIAYYEIHKRFGKLDWRELVEPTIILAREGSPVSGYVADIIQRVKEYIMKSPSLLKLLTSPDTGELIGEGELLRRPKLAETLEAISIYGPQVLYNSSLTDSLVEEIQAAGGIITREDFENYSVEWQEPIKFPLPNDRELLTPPPPSSGLVLGSILSILKSFDQNSSETIFSQRFTESMKHAYGMRSELGDPNFVDLTEVIANVTDPEYGPQIRQRISDTETSQDAEDYGGHYYTKPTHGTAHFSVLIPSGLSVSITSTINQIFGAMFVSESTGIIFNNEMDDFSNPGRDNGFGLAPSPANFIQPGKRPFSSMNPSIIVDKTTGAPVLVIGAAGAKMITTTTALTIYKHLFQLKNLDTAIEEPRIHHQLFPMSVYYENDINEITLEYLAKVGHNLTFTNSIAVVTGVSFDANLYKLLPAVDFRRGGEALVVY